MAQLPTCSVSGITYGITGQPQAGVRIRLVRVEQNGTIIIPASVDVTSAVDGTWSHIVPRSSTAYFCAPTGSATGISPDCFKPTKVSIPNAATANFGDLVPVVNLTALGITLKDEGVNLATQIGSVNFVGTGVTAVQTSPGLATVTVNTGVSNHNLLSSVHSDTTAGTVARGDLITGQGVSPTWQRLGIGLSGRYFRSDGTDPGWSAIQAADLPPIANAQIDSGAAIAYSKLNLAGSIVDSDVSNSAAISWSKVSKSGSSLGDLVNRSASDLSSGTLPDARFPATLPAVSGANLTNLNAGNIASGTLAIARGGTGVDLSATGGANQVVQQASAGGVFTVGQLAAANLINGVTGSGAVVLATSPTLTAPVLGTASATNLTSSVGSGADGLFLISSFLQSEEKLRMLVSSDGKTFTALSPSSTYTPLAGVVRDPEIIRYNNKYYLAHTTGTGFSSTTTSFQVAESTDLITWTITATVDCSVISGVNRTWGPVWFLDSDGSLHVFVTCSSSGTSGPFAIYELHPTNAGLTAWSTPVAVGGDFPANVIDNYLIKIGSTYYMWYKNEDTDYLEYATSTALTSGYAVQQTGNWAGWGNQLEGPVLVQMSASMWRIYMDGYAVSKYYYSESSDNFATWTTKTEVNLPDQNLRNIGIIRVQDINTERDILGYLAQATIGVTGRPRIESLSLAGTAGLGYVQIANQSSAPSTPTTSLRLYADSSNRPAWKDTDGFVAALDTTAISADRVFTFQNASYTVAGTNTANNFTSAQTITLNSGTILSAGRQGATNPAFATITSGGSDVTGISITAAATGSGATVAATSSAANERLFINAAGNAQIVFGSTLVAKSATIGSLVPSTTGLFFGYDPSADRAFFASGVTDAGGNLPTRKPAIFDYSTFLFTHNGSAPDMFVASTGNVGVGTSSNINSRLTVVVDVGLTSANGVAPDWSIARLGTNVARITNGATGAGSLILGPSTASIGTSGVAVLAIGGSTAPSTRPADLSQAYVVDWNGAGTAAFHFQGEEAAAFYQFGSAFVTPSIRPAAVAFASLGTPANGQITYCPDCTIANPCAGSGTGAIAKRLNGVWVCN